MKRLLRPFQPLWREARLFHLNWALREIHPAHPDVPEIVLEIRHLQDERNPSFAPRTLRA